MINKNKFGENWDLLGTPKKSEAWATVGAISDNKENEIGLTAMQMANLGTDYGVCSVIIDGSSTRVGAYNAFGAHSQRKDKIWISGGLAKELGLDIGSKIALRRIMDRQGRIKYSCEGDESNPFGQTWYKLEQPVEAVVASIDDDGYNSEIYRVGLSAVQMRNLDIDRRSEPISKKDILKVVGANSKGLLDGQDFGNLNVGYDGKMISAQVYNAFGERSLGGCGIRISSILADDLKLKLEDKVSLSK